MVCFALLLLIAINFHVYFVVVIVYFWHITAIEYIYVLAVNITIAYLQLTFISMGFLPPIMLKYFLDIYPLFLLLIEFLFYSI